MKKSIIFILLIPILLGGTTAMAEEPSGDRVLIYDYDTKKFEIIDKVIKSEEEWKKELSPEVFKITRKKGTERAFTGKYNKHYKKSGVYQCVNCGTDLYAADTQFDSGTGWPSFYQAVADENIEYVDDFSFFMHRTELVCKRCGSHLGHVFNDGPPPTGKRHCINSASLKFKKT